MAGLAVDARLRPGGAVGVGVQVVVGAELAHMAVEAGGVEGVGPLLPVDRLLGRPGAEVAHAAGRGVEPLFGAHVIGHRQGLEASPLQGGQEIIDVLAAQGVEDGVFFLLAFGVGFQDPAGLGADVGPVAVLADDQVFRLGRQVGPGELRGVGLHGQPVPGGGPELVKLSVTFDAALRAGVEGEFREECRVGRLHLRLRQGQQGKTSRLRPLMPPRRLS